MDEYLAKEVGLGRVLGPPITAGLPATVNRFGVIPKNHQPGKWCLIVDLSHPKGESVNDGIEPELCSLKYMTVDEVVQAIGPQTKMAKFDIESAYQLIPVHLEDRPLLGMRWRDNLDVNTALPFGLRSAPKIFNAVADVLQWIFEEKGVRLVKHYLDDFITFGPPHSEERQEVLDQALQLCQRPGVPTAAHKTEGPGHVLTSWTQQR